MQQFAQAPNRGLMNIHHPFEIRDLSSQYGIASSPRIVFHYSVCALVELYPTIRTVPFGRATWYLGQPDTVKMKPFSVTLLMLAAPSK